MRTPGDVVLPQALRLALPGTNTMLVDTLKSTSLLVTISAAELMSQGRLIASATFRALDVYLVIAALYFAIWRRVVALARASRHYLTGRRPDVLEPFRFDRN